MLVLFLAILITCAFGVTLFLLLISGDIEQLKNTFAQPQHAQLPFVTLDGKLVRTKEELEAELQYLQEKLADLKKSLETSKAKVLTASASITELSRASVEAKRYYLRLKDEIARNEQECELLQTRIDSYSETNKELQKRLQRRGIDADVAVRCSAIDVTLEKMKIPFLSGINI